MPTVRFLAKHLDLLLVLFPFEVPIFAPYLRTACVGPSVLEVEGVRAEVLRKEVVAQFALPTRRPDEVRKRHKNSSTWDQGRTNLLLLPGSREQEVRKHLPIMLDAVCMVIRHPYPSAHSKTRSFLSVFMFEILLGLL